MFCMKGITHFERVKIASDTETLVTVNFTIPPFSDHVRVVCMDVLRKNVKEEVAVCNKCKISIQCRGLSTSGQIRNPKNKHDIEKSAVVSAKRPAVDDVASTSANTKQQISTFFIRHS